MIVTGVTFSTGTEEKEQPMAVMMSISEEWEQFYLGDDLFYKQGRNLVEEWQSMASEAEPKQKGALNDDEKAKVLDIDNAILYREMLSFMDAKIYDPEPELLSTPVFEFVGFEECEKEFLEHFYTYEKNR